MGTPYGPYSNEKGQRPARTPSARHWLPQRGNPQVGAGRGMVRPCRVRAMTRSPRAGSSSPTTTARLDASAPCARRIGAPASRPRTVSPRTRPAAAAVRARPRRGSRPRTRRPFPRRGWPTRVAALSQNKIVHRRQARTRQRLATYLRTLQPKSGHCNLQPDRTPHFSSIWPIGHPVPRSMRRWPSEMRTYTPRGSAGGHVHEAAVVALEGDGDRGGGSVTVLGHDQVGLTGPG